ncbi:DUF3775 domain-containing protein [Falsihalocynthiibacter arcticus]|nr:DUF3775 domain-containing protein [Falsihalocynthiibacter arcticus]
MVNSLTIAPDFLRRLLFKMRAETLGDEDTPRDARDNALPESHHITLNEEVGTEPSHEKLIEEIDAMIPDHQYELVALLWVGRGDFGEADWEEALSLAAKRSFLPTAHYLLSHPLAADDITNGLEELGHDHLLQNGIY